MLTPLEHLKIELLVEGIRLTPAARVHLTDLGKPLTLADYATTSGIPLRLPGEIWVNAPVSEHNPNFVQNSPHVLNWSDGGFTIESSGEAVPVTPLPIPEYSQRRNSAGEPHHWYGLTHTDRVRVSPIGGCSNSCRFCDLPQSCEYRQKPVELLLECIREALMDTIVPARHILISGGTPFPRDFGYLGDVYDQVLDSFSPIPVDIMMLPLPGLLDVSDLQRRGVNELSINLELFNDALRAQLIPEKAAIPKDRWLDSIEDMVETFGLRVRSLVIVGLEPMEDTLRAVEALAQRGCEPVLSPFRPSPRTPMARSRHPTVDALAETFLRARDVVERYDVKLGPKCIPCQHNTLSFPDGTDYYHS